MTLRAVGILIVATGLVVSAQAPVPAPQTPAAPGRPSSPARDTPSQPQAAQQPQPTGKISGRVVAADTGRAIARARVNLSAPQFSGRTVLTDSTGAFELTGLPEARFNLNVSKSGYINLSYGQRRPLQPGTPLQLAAGQELKGIEFRLPRGSAISGRVLDENGEPMPGTPVRVLAFQYAQGSRQLMPAGSAQTDDRGEYRVWGLNPGDYYVTANPQNVNVAPAGPPVPAGRGGAAGRGALPALPAPPVPTSGDDPMQAGYAPTYYPGVPSVNEARPLTLGLSAELNDISFNVLLVRTARVSGRVTNADGTAATNVNVNLTAEGPTTNGRGGPFGNYSGRGQAEGRFSIGGVPPGRYTLVARSMNNRMPAFGTLPVVVSGYDVSDVLVSLLPPASVAGTITLQSTQTATLPNLEQFRITASAGQVGGPGPNGNSRVQPTGAFTLDGLEPGPHVFNGQAPRGWMLKSVVVDGRETVDLPLDVRPGQKITGVSVVFTDRIGGITGAVVDDRGAPVSDYTILVFPQDEALWHPQARQIMTTRPDQNGTFQLRGLPAGQYLVTPIDPVQQGEWFEPIYLQQHRQDAKRVSIGEGDTQTVDFKLSR